MALGESKHPAAFSPLVLALKDQHGDVRACAANGLASLGDVRAVEPLIDLLGDKTPIETLEAAGGYVFGEPPPFVEDRALFALCHLTDLEYDRDGNHVRQIGFPMLGSDPTKWRQWWAENKEKRLDTEAKPSD